MCILTYVYNIYLPYRSRYRIFPAPQKVPLFPFSVKANRLNKTKTKKQTKNPILYLQFLRELQLWDIYHHKFVVYSWAFINGIIQYVLFGIWLHSFNVIFLRFIPVVEFILFCYIIFHYIITLQFVYTICIWWSFGVVSNLGLFGKVVWTFWYMPFGRLRHSFTLDSIPRSIVAE